MPDFHLEHFLVLRTGLTSNLILYRSETPALKPFLQRGLVVRTFESLDAVLQGRDEEGAAQKCSCSAQACVQVDGADDRFVRIGK